MANREIGMPLEQRAHILRNLPKLLDKTDYAELMHACVEYGLLTYQMRNTIESLTDPTLNSNQLQKNRHTQLLLKITKRGPDAYQILKEICRYLNYTGALSILYELDGASGGTGRVNGAVSDFSDEFQSISNNRRLIKKNCSHTPSPTNSQTNITNNSNSKNISDNGNGDCPILALYQGSIEPKLKRNVIKSKIQQEDTIVGSYPMHSKDHRGILFLVNIIDFINDPERRRNGAEADTHSLMHLFSELGFKIFKYENLTQQNFFTLLKQAIASDYARQTECFVLALMTHGSSVHGNQLADFADGSSVNVKNIEDCFRHEVCPNLVHKPKILIFPFCRGTKPDSGYNLEQSIGMGIRNLSLVTPRNPETDGCAIRAQKMAKIASSSDMMICYASVNGYETHRDPDFGSWYIQKFCEQMAQHAHNRHFEDILKMIQHTASTLRSAMGTLQMGSYTNAGFNKLLYFNPGWWKEA